MRLIEPTFIAMSLDSLAAAVLGAPLLLMRRQRSAMEVGAPREIVTCVASVARPDSAASPRPSSVSAKSSVGGVGAGIAVQGAAREGVRAAPARAPRLDNRGLGPALLAPCASPAPRGDAPAALRPGSPSLRPRRSRAWPSITGLLPSGRPSLTSTHFAMPMSALTYEAPAGAKSGGNSSWTVTVTRRRRSRSSRWAKGSKPPIQRTRSSRPRPRVS